ncbi:hemin-degrading factor [Marinobacter sp. 71-i]|uniref:Hemin-degrading factor n=1 Tax=Marinobacter iranensis TaxID=2962607 RepID=A0ABT5Y6W7_9GAMM|nr:ChuX/HutX family heme-like substrate-binding protein [Marinobacter iranensis]MDF0749420.1 hemin-degrading factor [Marinobacter iranensis]
MATETTVMSPRDQLAQRWADLREDNPKLRIRQAANELQVSELELLLCREPEDVRPLKPEFSALLEAMESVGEVMILSRNEPVVHEVTGTFKDFHTSSSGAMGLAVGQMDVRVFFRNWHFGYQVQEQVRSGLRESLQFFDAHGQAIQKIYRTDNTDAESWQVLIGQFLADASTTPDIQPPRAPLKRADRQEINAEALRQDWASLKDVHHFNAMLKRHSVDRLTALELVGPTYARRLDSGSNETMALEQNALGHLLTLVQKSQCPIMVFVGNPGIVQIHTGPVGRVVPTGPWLNILDPAFNLHANVASIQQWWRVQRPSSDGPVTSLEGYDANGELVITLFGARKPGQPESPQWQREMRTLESQLCG